MHIPSLEILYQTLLKQGDILSKQKQIVQDNLKRFEKPSVVEKLVYFFKLIIAFMKININ